MAWAVTKLLFDTFIVGSDVAVAGAFLAALRQMKVSRSAAGISLQSIIAILSLRLLHACSHFYGIHFVPKMLPMLPFQILDWLIVLAGFLCVFGILTKHYNTYEVEKDNFGIQLFDYLEWVPKTGPLSYRPVAAASVLYFVVLVVSGLWFVVRKTSHASMSLSVYTCVCEVTSAVALIPQLWMFHKDKRVPSLLGTFVVMVAVGRACTLLFWALLPMLVGRWAIPTNRNIQISLEVMNLWILSDFIYYWAKAKLRGQKEIILDYDCDV